MLNILAVDLKYIYNIYLYSCPVHMSLDGAAKWSATPSESKTKSDSPGSL